jgi:CheY-like chemotaxis protein
VFERFAQEERGRGLGLGLAIVHDIVALHGGTVAAESEGHGRGSTFHVTLPIISAEEKDRHIDAVRSVNLSGRSVLVVDDDPPVLEMLEAAITGAGARVISASTCAAAMNSIESAPPDVVVSDLLMPFEDGFALIQRLRVHDAKKQRHTHAIAISAMPPQETRERTREAGYDAFIAKPLDPAVLIREISRLLTD